MYIKTLQLENLRRFQKLFFNLERPDGSYAGWTVFVGGNSSGKSTILRSAALALMGPEYGSRLLGSPAGWIYKGQKKASVELELFWDKEHDRFKKGGSNPGAAISAGVRWLIEDKTDEVPQFRALDKRNATGTRIQSADRGPWSPNSFGWFSAGYGPMRRLTGSSSEAMRFSVSKETDSRFATLFREDAALSESEEWLRRMHARGLEAPSASTNRVLDGVKALMGDGLLPHGMKISRITVDHVFVEDATGIELPMRDISDGCRSIYATVLDLVHGLFEVYGADDLFEDKDGRVVIARPGVVIIDEIEAHLHPSWQRDIPEWLKLHFPKIQFLVSTHSPLIAQSADPNGLFILPLQGDVDQEARPATDAEYERIRWGTALKTVLGVAFGLSNTRTNWANQQLKRWQELNAKKNAGVDLAAGEKSDYKKLEKQLALALDSAPIDTL